MNKLHNEREFTSGETYMSRHIQATIGDNLE